MILDTVAISALLDGDLAVRRLLVERERQHVPVITLGEYRFGLCRSRRMKELERLLDQLEEESVVLDVGRATARVYAGIREALRAAGTPIADNDLWIAALAIEHGLPIASRDAHFDRVPGVRRVGW